MAAQRRSLRGRPASVSGSLGSLLDDGTPRNPRRPGSESSASSRVCRWQYLPVAVALVVLVGSFLLVIFRCGKSSYIIRHA